MAALAKPKIPPQWTCVAFGVCLPTAVTFTYFVLVASYPIAWQQMAFVGGKLLQLLLPVVWVRSIRQNQPKFGSSMRPGVLMGVIFGMAIGTTMLLLYHFWLQSTPEMELAAEALREKIGGFAIDKPIKYLYLASFYCVFHSLFEEYYWRWFVFGQLRGVTSVGPAMIVSSLGFTFHHILVLGLLFGWGSLITYFFSLSIAVGGAVWAWLYENSGSLVPSWLSHLIIDAAIFMVGFDMVLPLFE